MTRSFFYLLTASILFFAFSPAGYTPAIVVNHDKLAHFMVFLFLSFGMRLTFPTCTSKNQILILIMLAAGIEIVQYLFAHRELSVVDFFASLAGVLVYMIMSQIFGKVR